MCSIANLETVKFSHFLKDKASFQLFLTTRTAEQYLELMLETNQVSNFKEVTATTYYCEKLLGTH